MERNIALYPWLQFARNLLFWQAIWFLFFQTRLSAAEAILLYAIYDIATTALEVPSGYMSDRIGRRFTLVASALSAIAGAGLLCLGDSFAIFALAQIMLGASTAFASGTDSALLYESLSARGHADRLEAQELRAWRFSFTALALSAVAGGAMALWIERLPFWAGLGAAALTLALTLRLREPPGHGDTPQGAELMRLGHLRDALTRPVLLWLFVLGLAMYGFSHIPYVFGQPFILQALDRAGLAGEAPLVSGATSSVMMLISVATSLIALRLRRALGLAGVLLLAFGMQIALVAVLALTQSVLAIALLFFRMVPDSLSHAFILARIQPLLEDDSRATYLSLRSFCGRLLFAGSLWLASGAGSATGAMGFDELRLVLGGYALAGVVVFAGLALSARRVAIDDRQRPPRRTGD